MVPIPGAPDFYSAAEMVTRRRLPGGSRCPPCI